MHYHCLGRLQQPDACRPAIQERSLQHHVTLHGPVSHAENLNHLQHADIFILLSEPQPSGDFEGFGVAILEANHFGVPAIGTRDSGIADAIDDGNSGFLVDPGKKEEIIRAVEKILANRDHFTEGARSTAARHPFLVSARFILHPSDLSFPVYGTLWLEFFRPRIIAVVNSLIRTILTP